MKVPSFKLVLLGDSAVGKSSIVMRFVKSMFNECQEATIGAAYLTKGLDCGEPKRPIQFELWDTAGQERYHSLAPMYYRGAHAAIIVYDITNKGTFERATGWVKEILHNAPSVKVIALTGNKLDLEDQRAVSFKTASEYASIDGLLFHETSAKTAANLETLFTAIGDRLIKEIPLPEPRENALSLEDTANRNHQCCR